VDQKPGTTPNDAPPQDPHDSQPAEGAAAEQSGSGFGARGRARRRVRFLRKARELAYRDLGGLVFNLHQFGQRNDALVLGKLATLSRIDSELRTIESALQDRRPITILREAGITACPRCAAIHGSEDRYCPNCGLPMARNVDLPVAGAPAGAPPSAAPAVASQPPPAVSPATGAPAQANPVAAPPVQPTPTFAPSSAPAVPMPAMPGPSPTPAPGAAAPASPAPTEANRSPEESTEILHPQVPGS
jgi:hypothetical protein